MAHAFETFGRGLSKSDLASAIANLIQVGDPDRRGRATTGDWAGPFLHEPTGRAAAQSEEWRARASRLVGGEGPGHRGIALALDGEPDSIRRLFLSRSPFDLLPERPNPIMGFQPPPPELFGVEQPLELLSQAALIDAVHFVTAPAQAAAEWRWPLDLGVYADDHRSWQLVRGVRSRLRSLVTPVVAERATTPIELLILPHSLDEAFVRVRAHPPLPRVQAVLVLGSGRASQHWETIDRLRREVRADIGAVLALPPHQELSFLDRMMGALARDVDLDVALTLACREVGAGVPVLVAARGAFARAHLGRWVGTTAVRLSRVRGLRLRRRGPVPGGPAEVVGLRLAAMAADRLDWTEGDARVLASLGRLERAASPPEQARFVQAELYAEGRSGSTKVKRAPLVAGPHRLEVWIGPPTEEAVVAPVALPDEDLPTSAAGHELTIILASPLLDPPTRYRPLHYFRSGTSERVSFEFDISRRLRHFEARIVVLYQTRILQTLVLSAPVGQGEPAPLALEIETVQRRDLSNLVGQRPFQAAILVNELGGQRSVSVFVGEHASLMSFGGALAEATRGLAAQLEEATNLSDRYGPPDSPGTEALLATLARLGSLLREALLDMPLVKDQLARAQRIQIIAARADEPILPLELCYDGPAPDAGARTCPQWSQALARGECQRSCPPDRRTVVCPVAFWGTSRAIERHVYSKEEAAKLGPNDFALQTEPTDGRARLRIAGGSVCATAAQARALNAAAVDRAFAAARDITQPGGEVDTWSGWRGRIADNPSLLVLFPHTDEERGVRTLWIGDQQKTFITSVDKSYVGTGGGPGPIVLLLGCSTAPALQAFQSFVARFQRGGASIVIGTLCEILGRHAAPIATLLLEELRDSSPDSRGIPLSDLMLVVRRKLLAQGYPIVMAVAAYGDADWRL